MTILSDIPSYDGRKMMLLLYDADTAFIGRRYTLGISS